MLESELEKKTPLKKTELLTGGQAGLLNYRCHTKKRLSLGETDFQTFPELHCRF